MGEEVFIVMFFSCFVLFCFFCFSYVSLVLFSIQYGWINNKIELPSNLTHLNPKLN